MEGQRMFVNVGAKTKARTKIIVGLGWRPYFVLNL